MPYTFFMMVGKGDTPIFELEYYTDPQKEDKSQLKHFIIHAALDNCDEAVWTNPALFNEFNVSAYVTSGYVRFLVMQDREPSDSTKHFFTEVLLDPFYEVNSRITSASFKTRVTQLLKKILYRFKCCSKKRGGGDQFPQMPEWRVDKLLSMKRNEEDKSSAVQKKNKFTAERAFLKVVRWGRWYDPSAPGRLLQTYGPARLNEEVDILKCFIRRTLYLSFNVCTVRLRNLVNTVNTVKKLWKAHNGRMKDESAELMRLWEGDITKSPVGSKLTISSVVCSGKDLRQAVIDKLRTDQRKKYHRDYNRWAESCSVSDVTDLQFLAVKKILFSQDLRTFDTRKLRLTFNCFPPAPPSLAHTTVLTLQKMAAVHLKESFTRQVYQKIKAGEYRDCEHRVPQTLKRCHREIVEKMKHPPSLKTDQVRPRGGSIIKIMIGPQKLVRRSSCSSKLASPGKRGLLVAAATAHHAPPRCTALSDLKRSTVGHYVDPLHHQLASELCPPPPLPTQPRVCKLRQKFFSVIADALQREPRL